MTLMAQALQRLLLDLAHPLPRDPQHRPDLFERARLGRVEPEIEPENHRLAITELTEAAVDALGE